MASQNISTQIKQLSSETLFSQDVISRLTFHYGYIRTVELINSLQSYPTTYPIRVNTTVTTSEKLLKTLQEKNIPIQKHPILEDCLLVEVHGPTPIKQKEKIIGIHYSRKINTLLIGNSLGARDFIPDEHLNIGDEVTIIGKNNEPLANGILMMSADDIKRNKKGVAIKIIESKYKIPNLTILKEFLRGQFIHQSISSITVGTQIKLQPKDRLLDMASGSGELLTYIWQNNAHIDSKIIALESSNTRWSKFEETIKLLRMYKAPIEKVKLHLKKFAERFNRNETFDWIIVNPPSSEIGTRPKYFENTREDIILRNIKIQKRYLREAARLLKHNGTLFYFTKSLDPAENEGNIKYAVEELGLTIDEQKVFVGEKCTANFKNANLLQYLYPDIHDTDGQFIAKLTK